MNRLAGSTSPYLLQHADNPVDWYPWGEEAFRAARERDVPILLSVGYAACHWCHVMAHESFEDPEIAALMNRWFVNVKVDREERPDVDRYYMKALHLFGEQGGWPLTMFLTPDGRPIWGGTYFPPEPRFGRPSFRQVLEEIARLWREDRDKLLHNADALTRALKERQETAADAATGEIPADLPQRVAYHVTDLFDERYGGLRGAPKFPMASLLRLLWIAGRQPERDMVTLTLTHLCQGGIWDHLEGGLARYSTDERWLVPHFEKMLYDNAQLIDNLACAWLGTKNPLFRQRILETVQFLKSWLHIPGAGLAASLDADSEGEEGRYYVWTWKELNEIVPEENRNLFFRTYDVSHRGNWEGRIILNRLQALALMDDETERTLADIRRQLAEARRRRPPPARDNKVLASWNGLAIAALARAGLALQEASLIRLAEKIFQEVTRGLEMKDGSLCQSFNQTPSPFPATADGMAAMARAALWLHMATGQAKPLEKARRWLDLLEADYLAESGNAFVFTRRDADAHVPDQIFAEDEAVPNYHALIVEALTLMSFFTGEPRWKDRAERILARFASEMAANPVAHAALLVAMHELTTGVHATLITSNGHGTAPWTDDSRETALYAAACRATRDVLPILRIAPDAELADTHPAAHMLKAQRKEDAPALLLCRGQACSIPITDPAQVSQALAILGM